MLGGWGLHRIGAHIDDDSAYSEMEQDRELIPSFTMSAVTNLGLATAAMMISA